MVLRKTPENPPGSSRMYNRNRSPLAWQILIHLIDVLAIIISFLATFLISRTNSANSGASPEYIAWSNSLLIGGLTICLFYFSGLYRWTAFLRWKVMFIRLIIAVSICASILILFRSLLNPFEKSGFFIFIFLYCSFCFLISALGRLIIRFSEIHYFAKARRERVAFIGWSESMQMVMCSLSNDILSRVSVTGFISVEGSQIIHPPFESGYACLGALGSLKEILHDYGITILLLNQRGIPEEGLESITEICADSAVRLMMIPWTSKVWGNRYGIRRVGGIPLLVIYDLGIDALTNRLLKRLVDIVGSLVGIVISAPIILILMILIRLESPGPVLYRQVRSGQRGKTFEIIKLRSMYPDAEKTTGVVWTVENDPRRLRIGAFIRKWNMDELPQFWNVLFGEMSLVGPRPERPELIEKFRLSLRYYNLRNLCKPGMTGWASIHGLRGNTSLEERVKYDLYYIENWSLMLDFEILLKTLLPPKNAY